MTLKQKPTHSVLTKHIFNFPPEDVWKELLFYENLKKKQPILLRLLLPVPIGIEGSVEHTGDEALCLYQGGHLRKRLTQVVENELYQFEITEQNLSIKSGIQLSGGYYRLQNLPNQKTEVTAVTRYQSVAGPGWFWTPVEKMVCHWFHRYLLKSINHNIETKKKYAYG